MTARVSPPVATREQHASKGKERARVGLQHSNVREYATSLAAVFPLNSQLVDVKVPPW